MNKTKVILKVQTIVLLAVMLALIVCLAIGSTASADTVGENEYDYMSFDIAFLAYCKNGLQKMIPVAGVQMHLGIDYIPSTDSNYDYYVFRADVKVAPVSTHTLKRFTILPACHNQSGHAIENEQNNHAQVIRTTASYKTDIYAREGVDFSDHDVDIYLNSDRLVKFDYESKHYDSNDADIVRLENPPKYEIQSVNTSILSGYKGKPMIIRRYDRSNDAAKSHLREDKGKTYTALYYATYKVAKGITDRRFAFVFKDLEIWGQSGQPSYQLSNDDNLTVYFSWTDAFSNRSINARMTDMSGSQYLVKALVAASLPTVNVTDTLFTYKDIY